MDKGTISNLLSASLFGAGLVLPRSGLQDAILSTGLFAFSGGITNALAVKMLFDRIPGLAGSGVIPARFKEIRAEVKDLVVKHFFDEAHLRRYFRSQGVKLEPKRYLKPRSGSRGPIASYIESRWDDLLGPQAVQAIVDQQMEKLMDSSMGGLLLMVGPDNARPAVLQFINAFTATLQSKVLEAASQADSEGTELEIDEDALIADIRVHVDKLLSDKLEALDANTVKKMMEAVIRRHLGWLVVWGNVFGALLGLLAVLLKASYGLGN